MYPHRDNLQTLLVFYSTAVARRAARCDVPLNQILRSGAGQRSQEPRRAVRKLRRRRWPVVQIQVSTPQGRRPGWRGGKTREWAPDVRKAFCRTPLGDRGRSPGDFLGTFVSLQKYLARGRNIPTPPSRPPAKRSSTQIYPSIWSTRKRQGQSPCPTSHEFPLPWTAKVKFIFRTACPRR